MRHDFEQASWLAPLFQAIVKVAWGVLFEGLIQGIGGRVVFRPKSLRVYGFYEGQELGNFTCLLTTFCKRHCHQYTI